MMCMPIPIPALQLDPSTSTYHVADMSTCVNFSMKSFIAWPFISIVALNFISYSLSSIVHLVNHPDIFGLCNILLGGWLVRTLMGWVRKCAMKRWVSWITMYVIFWCGGSILGYLQSFKVIVYEYLFHFHWLTNTVLMVFFEAMMYRNSSSSRLGVVSKGRLVRCFFMHENTPENPIVT